MWISVKDRLPIEEGKVMIAFLEPFFGKFTTEIETGYYCEEESDWHFWYPDRPVRGLGVTHWQPLPEPPEE